MSPALAPDPFGGVTLDLAFLRVKEHTSVASGPPGRGPTGAEGTLPSRSGAG